jgi:hypothetical protein
MTQRNQADQDVEAGEVFVKCIEKTGLSGCGFSRQGEIGARLSQRRLAKEKMQLAGLKDGGLAYTECGLEVQNGNAS